MNEINFPTYLPAEDRIIEVLGYLPPTPEELTCGKGYILDDKIYAYTDNPDNISVRNYPIVWIQDPDNNPYWRTWEPDDMGLFTVNNLASMDVDHINEQLVEGEQLYSEEAINDMNMATSVFAPIVNEEDDFLKKVVKQIIIEKHMDINRLKSCMCKKHGLTNLRTALINKTKMSVLNFMVWAELLGFDFEIIVTDNGRDKISPLTTPLSYKNTTDTVSKIDKDEK